jgi:hypothetical protein
LIYHVNYEILYLALRDRVRELGYPVDEEWECNVLTVSRSTRLPAPDVIPQAADSKGVD